MDEGSGIGKIVVDGREYRSVDEMPPEVRRVYEEALAAARGMSAQGRVVEVTHGGTRTVITSRGTGVFVDGKQVDPEDLPQGLREAYRSLAEGRDLPPGAEVVGDPQGHDPERRVHSVRIEHETRFGGPLHRNRRGQRTSWVNVAILLICAAILVAIALAY